MDQEHWQRVRVLFHSALEHECEERPAFLDHACGGDADLRRQVELLLAREGEAGSFLEIPAMGYSTPTQTGDVTVLGRQFGPYRIVSSLGAGGMGEVYRAHDSKLGRDVAIKTLPAEFARDSERRARFRREARTLASLNHPNIAAIYGLEESGDVDWLVLELVEGETLRGPLPIGRALDYARQVAEGLGAAHEKGIIHRDLKPANVKVTPKGTIKVLDFGLAKMVWGPEAGQDVSQPATSPNSAETLTGDVLGTPGYMSPEQTRGQAVDQRTDIWAFGCLLYELLTGKRAFHGDSGPDTAAAVLEGEPDWHALPAKSPARIRELLRQCLQKDAERRLSSIAEARRAIEKTQRGGSRWQLAVAAAGLLAIAVGAALWLRGPARPSDRSGWVQLTSLPDPVGQPALSADGRMLAFVRSPRTWYGEGEIYVKPLPDGQPVQLTRDGRKKMGPAFSPDGTRIAYTVVDAEANWDTWVVPVRGGEAQPWLRNTLDIVWTGPRHLLFSEVKSNPGMAIVEADESMARKRDIYVPLNKRFAAHYPQASPDGKWVLLAEIANYGNWEPCRVVPMGGSSSGFYVGPRDAACTFGAWSPDGKWVYVTSKAGGLYHIWRQRFPDGQPEQFTSGPTEEEGVAMAPDGRSFVTAVGLQSSSIWVHDKKGERQVSPLEGNAAYPKFTPDGKKLCYRIVKAVPFFGTLRDPGEVWIADLDSGHSEPLAPGFPVLDYNLSFDGRQAVLEAADSAGKPRLWLVSLVRRSPPRQIPGVEGRIAHFGPSGEIFFRHNEGSSGFVYRVRPDGTGLRKAFELPILGTQSASADGKWLQAWAQLPGNGPATKQMLPLDGGSPVIVGGSTFLQWSSSEDTLWLHAGAIPDGRTYIIPLPKGKLLPPIPPGGFHSEQEIAGLPGARMIDAIGTPGPSRDVYAIERRTVQRNLYRIPIP